MFLVLVIFMLGFISFGYLGSIRMSLEVVFFFLNLKSMIVFTVCFGGSRERFGLGGVCRFVGRGVGGMRL